MNKGLDYFSVIFTLIILYLSFLLVRPFISPLITAIIVSYIIYPFYKKINQKVKNKSLSIFLILLSVVFLILIPLGLMLYTLVDDISGLIIFFKNLDVNSIPLISRSIIPSWMESFLIKVPEDLASSLLSEISKFVLNLPNKFISIIVFLFAIVLFLKDGIDIIKKFKIVIPIEKVQKQALIEEFKLVTKSMIYSTFLSSIFSGIIGAILFYLFDIPNSILWGFFIALLSPIPMIGNSPIWIGGMIYLILSGKLLMGIILMSFGILLTQLENMFFMKILGSKSEINSFLVLIGIISGLKVFGVIGIIIGPLILSILITLIRFYTKNYKEKFDF